MLRVAQRERVGWEKAILEPSHGRQERRESSCLLSSLGAARRRELWAFCSPEDQRATRPGGEQKPVEEGPRDGLKARSAISGSESARLGTQPLFCRLATRRGRNLVVRYEEEEESVSRVEEGGDKVISKVCPGLPRRFLCLCVVAGVMSLSLSRSPETAAATGDPHWNPGSNGMIRGREGQETETERLCVWVGERRFVTQHREEVAVVEEEEERKASGRKPGWTTFTKRFSY